MSTAVPDIVVMSMNKIALGILSVEVIGQLNLRSLLVMSQVLFPAILSIRCLDPGVCADPGQVSNAVRTGDVGPFFTNYQVRFFCRIGFRGGGTMICRDNGEWTAKPYCVDLGVNLNIFLIHNRVFREWNMTFTEFSDFGESNKSLKHELWSI